MCEECGCKSGHECSCGCECCGGSGHFERHYQTKAKKITELEGYLTELRLEVQAVEEHLADLQK